ncbi:MAG: DotA/TraY family protein [Pseudomonadota bacterium]
MRNKVPTFGTEKIKAGDVAGYFFLPRILPRLQELFTSGFGYFAFLIAQVYQAVRILPANHPYTNPANIGKFGIRQAILAAANNITLSRRNIDQVIIFFAIVAGVIVLFLQFIALFANFLIDSAQASGVFAGLFATPNPQTDIAFLLLDHVFGIPDFFGSAINGTLPTPFHAALQSLFQFYNFALLVVAVLIFLYYVVVVIAETAQTGTPFGKRFNHIYAPFRLVVAIGLLVPLNWGFNASQYITLLSAKMGSGLATNGWLVYNRGLQNAMGVDSSTLLARPQTPEIDEMVAFMTVVHACRESYCLNKVAPPGSERICGDSSVLIEPFLTVGDQAIDFMPTPYVAARTFYQNGDILITFGHLNPDAYNITGGVAGVMPYCGKVQVPLSAFDGNDTRGVRAEFVQEQYFNLIKLLWVDPELRALGERFARAKLMPSSAPDAISDCWRSDILGDGGNCSSADGTGYVPPSAVKNRILSRQQSSLSGLVTAAYNFFRGQLNLIVRPEILARGWGGAGIAYNDLADINGKFFDAVFSLPMSNTFPYLMELVERERQRQDGALTQERRFDPNLAEGQSIPGMSEEGDMPIAQVMNEAYQYWANDQTTNEDPLTSNVFFDTINSLFGTRGLFCMIDPFPGPTGAPDHFREDCGVGTHPMVQLIALGKGLVDSAINNLGTAMAFAAMGGAGSVMNQHAGASLQALSGFYLSIATVGLGIGFTLYYVVPFLPFIYFFFAVGAWVKTIFEAMVGAPLWALAHLRIDGDGFPGSSANNGYFLIFEIFVRPILTVFGLVGGFAIFTAMAHILHEIFTLVIINLSGYQPDGALTAGVEIFRRNVLDEFFYTVIYVIIIYMMATASFKMIDMVPNFIIRWLGQSVASFGDQRDDPTEGLTQYAMIGGHMVGGQLGSALTSAARGAGQGGAGVLALALQDQDNGGTPPGNDGTPPPGDDGTPPPRNDGTPPPGNDGTPPPRNDGTPPPGDDGTPPPDDGEPPR